MENVNSLITDGQSLIGAVNRFGRSLRVYDNGFGPIWIHRDSMGISGLVRAQTWQDAYAICEDEFFPSGDVDAADEMAEIQALPDGEEKDHLQACWDESFGYRGNGRTEKDGSVSYVYAKNLNGDSLNVLTDDLAKQLEITISIESNE
jgi:hypothetical protein